MKRTTLCIASALVGLAALGSPLVGAYEIGDRLHPSKSATAVNSPYRQITWDALVPADWDPIRFFRGLNVAKLRDGDPKAIEILTKMKKAWNQAPVNASIDGTKVRLAGFIVPLDTDLYHVKEFLLVPYFGACIHVPPPPANQVVHVFAKQPLDNSQIMGTVWVSGTMRVGKSETDFGGAGYSMHAAAVEPYKEQ